MNDLHLAVIGTRNIGRSHIRRALACPGVRVAAIVEPDPQRRQACAAEFAIPTAHAEAEACYADPGIDAVVLAVPNHLHAPLSIAAMAAGKHVLVEKPMASCVAEAEAMVAASQRHDRFLMIGMNQRFTPQAGGLKRLLEDGHLGRIQMARCWWNRNRPGDGLWQRGDWFLSTQTAGGGPLIDIGIHRLDQALWLLGFPEITQVTAQCSYGLGAQEAAARSRRYAVEDAAEVLLHLADGGCLHLSTSYFRNGPESDSQNLHLFGTAGGCDLGAGLWWQGGDDTPQMQPLPTDDSWPKSCIEHFARVLHGDQTLCATPEQGLLTQCLIACAYDSAQQQRSLPFTHIGERG